jgi:hypothetical protein
MDHLVTVQKIEVVLDGRPFKGDATEIRWHALTTRGGHPASESISPQEASKRLRELANHIDETTEPFPPDNNTQLVLYMACHLVPNPDLPSSIAGMTAEEKANLVEVVDKEPVARLPLSADDLEPFIRIATLLGRIGTMTGPLIPDVGDALQRINLVLRMWAGCVDTGKAIDEQTKSGPNTATIRGQKALQIEKKAADRVYAAGMEASIVIKRRRGEKYSFDGVPDRTHLARLKNL